MKKNKAQVFGQNTSRRVFLQGVGEEGASRCSVSTIPKGIFTPDTKEQNTAAGGSRLIQIWTIRTDEYAYQTPYATLVHQGKGTSTQDKQHQSYAAAAL